MLLGIRHAGLIVSDMEKSVDFYVNKIGFEVLQDFWDGSEGINNLAGTKDMNVHMIKMKSPDGSVIELLKYHGENVSHARNYDQLYSVGEAHIAIQVKNARDFYDHCKIKDIETLSEPIRSNEGIANVFFIFDPDKYRVEVVEII